MSAIVDVPSEEDRKRKETQLMDNSIKMASSASEDE
jgi:hypothetical protein